MWAGGSMAGAKAMGAFIPNRAISMRLRHFKASYDMEQFLPHSAMEVIGGGTTRFLPAFSNLHKPYSPFPLVTANCHMETIFASLFRSTPHVNYKRECLRTTDDGAIALDWVSGDHLRLPPLSPILVLLPGLTGGSEDSYVRHLLVRARSRGFRVVVFNSRGCGDSPVTTPQFYSASFLGDTCQVMSHIASRYPDAPVFAVGWSLGANILVNYMGTESINCPLSAAVSLCNPFNLVIADENFRKGFNIVYDKSLAKALRKILMRHASLFQDIEGDYNIPLAANARSVKEFDEALTRVSFGFESVDDYYRKSGSSDRIKHVSIPLLCIQAADDPIAPQGGIPRDDIRNNPNCMLIVTPKGGHLGWIAGSINPTGPPWTDDIVMEFLDFIREQNSIPIPLLEKGFVN